MARDFPYTGSDLKEIGKAVERLQRKLRWVEVGSGDPLEPYVADIVVKVAVPTVNEHFEVGELRFEDGWLGFFPYAVGADDE